VAVALNSGNLVASSRYVREQLAGAGLDAVRIVGSGHLDEYAIADLLARGAQVDAFYVGAALGSGAGNVAHGATGGALGVVYKEVAYVDAVGAEHPVIKVAGEKTTWPGRKEVYRHPGWKEDLVQLAAEPAPADYMRLLRPVVRSGAVVPGSLPPLTEIWELAQANLQGIPEPYRALSAAETYPVRFSPALQALRSAGIQATTPAAMPDAHETTDNRCEGNDE
jgi:nicotinate phosphoribosyltransferase